MTHKNLSAGYWIISGPLPLDGNPRWPNHWRAEYMPWTGGAFCGWGATEDEAKAHALIQAATQPTPNVN